MDNPLKGSVSSKITFWKFGLKWPKISWKMRKHFFYPHPHPHYPYRGPQRQPHLFMKNQNFKMSVSIFFIKRYRSTKKIPPKKLGSIISPKMDPKLTQKHIFGIYMKQFYSIFNLTHYKISKTLPFLKVTQS